jgi:uncharacterized protein (TIGR00369 family)
MNEWTAENPGFEQAVRDAVLSMPAARHLGFTFGPVAPGQAELIQPVADYLTQHDGHVQAGVLGSLADFAAGSAAGTLLPPGWMNMTIDYTVKILAPGKGTHIVARGRVVRPGNVITVAAADLYALDGPAAAGTLCATALVTLRNVRARPPAQPGTPPAAR